MAFRELIEDAEQNHPELKPLNDATRDKKAGFSIPAETCYELCGGRDKFRKVSRIWKAFVLLLNGTVVLYDVECKAYCFVKCTEVLNTNHHPLLRD